MIALALIGGALLVGWNMAADRMLPVPACVDTAVLTAAAQAVRQTVQSAESVFAAREANFDGATETRQCIGMVLVGGIRSRVSYTVRWDNRLVGAFHVEASVQDAFLADVKNRTADEIERAYGLAKRNGSAIDRCVSAGQVAAAYQQAHNEAAYARWKKVETEDCTAAGVPR